ncbi:hypothetical protein CKAN_00175900 [Cinnamomum micranthum f. kanehirae]|uniref:Letm1 RBD domain-containing protein n=1 Tax=Cinnamomum micranthum f. kanehirae TaxID=337451 RepID=A0A443N4M8_9MAGN|nr:hypothetical protein CKAN_00175900 [Cinnamomum micranthum f. kanehirae]
MMKDLWMGTRLLFIDISAALCILQKRISGHKLTKREMKKLKRVLNDIISVVPVAILMLIPVSAIGHAAILAAIKKYLPSLIPSPYSSERLDVIKQLKRTKKMDIQSSSNLKVSSSVLAE